MYYTQSILLGENPFTQEEEEEEEGKEKEKANNVLKGLVEEVRALRKVVAPIKETYAKRLKKDLLSSSSLSSLLLSTAPSSSRVISSTPSSTSTSTFTSTSSPTPPPTDLDPRPVARALFQKGISAYDAGNYDEAISAFTRAYELKPHPAVLRNIALSELMQGDRKSACKHFKRWRVEARPRLSDVAQIRVSIEDACR